MKTVAKAVRTRSAGCRRRTPGTRAETPRQSAQAAWPTRFGSCRGIVETDPDACIDRKPTVLPSEHVGRGRSVEQSRASEPPNESVWHAGGEGVEVAWGDRPCRKKPAPQYTPTPKQELNASSLVSFLLMNSKSKPTVDHPPGSHRSNSSANITKLVPACKRYLFDRYPYAARFLRCGPPVAALQSK